VGCQAIVTVPAAPDAQAVEEEMPILEALEEEISPTVDFKGDTNSISDSLGSFDDEADKQEAEESLAVLDDIFPSSPSLEFTTPEPEEVDLPDLDMDVDMDMDIDPFNDEGPSTVDFSENENTSLPPSTSMSGALDASFLDELMPDSPGQNSLESIGQDLGDQDSAIDLTSDLHAASLLDDSMSPMGPAGDESIPNLMDELSAEMPTDGNLGASLNDFTPGIQQAISDDLDFNFDEFNEPLASAPADSNHIAGARAHAITETPAFERGESEKPSNSRQIMMFVVLIGLAGVAAAVSLDFESLMDSGSATIAPQEAKLEELRQAKISAAVAQKKASAAKLAEEERLRKANRPLARDNVNQLRFSELSSAMKNTIADQPLKAWAAYRLQATYDTPVDAKQTPLPPVDSSDAMAVALEGVRLLVAGEGEPARLLLEGIWRKRKTGAPAVGLVLSRLYSERDMTKKAETVLSSLIQAHPKMLDARLDLANLIMSGNRPARGAQLLTENVTTDTSADHTLVRIGALLDKRRFSEASRLAQSLEPIQDTALPESLKATLLNAKAYGEILVGKTGASRKQLEASKKSPLEKALGLAQLTHMTGGKANEELQAFAATLPANASVQKARIVYLQTSFALEAKDQAAAKRYVEQVASLPPKLTQGWVQLARGDIALAAGKTKQARSSYKAGLKVRAAFPEANIALELSSGRKAKETLARLSRVRGDNRHPVITLALAQVMLRKGNHDGAISLYEQVLWTSPTADNPNKIVENLLRALTHAKQFERALKIGQSRYNNMGKTIEMAEQMAQIADTYGEPNARLFWHTEIDKVNPFTHKTVLARSRALLDLDREVEARINIEDFLKEKPDWRTAEITKQLARSWTLEDGVKARAFLKESIRSKPAPDTYILLGNLEEERSNRSNAIDAYTEALQLNPQLVDIRERLAGLLLKNGQLQEAANQLKFVTTHSPKNSSAREQLGDIYEDIGRPRLALEAYLNTIRYGHTSEDLFVKAARLQLYELGQLAPATRTLNRVLQINPDNPQAHYLIGVALKDQEQLQAAKAHFNRYLALAPDGEFAQEVRSELANLGTR
jgi:tetratricopeptide (TPR) repeat protein